MLNRPILMTALCASLLGLSACATAARTAIGTVGTASNVAIRTAGAAGTVAVKTAGITQSVATAAATGAANGVGRQTGQLAVQGVAAAGQAGFRAMTSGDSSISEETLAHRASLIMSHSREDLTIGNVYEEGERTDFLAIAATGSAANCFVIRERGTVSDATCRPVPE